MLCGDAGLVKFTLLNVLCGDAGLRKFTLLECCVGMQGWGSLHYLSVVWGCRLGEVYIT